MHTIQTIDETATATLATQPNTRYIYGLIARHHNSLLLFSFVQIKISFTRGWMGEVHMHPFKECDQNVKRKERLVGQKRLFDLQQ